MTTIEKLGLLQEEFFKKSGKLYENIELLGEVLYKSMLDDMTAVYTRESGLLLREAEAEYSATDYKIDCKEGLLLPSEKRSFLLRKIKRNAPAELIYREVLAEAQGIFTRRTQAIERLAAALEESPADTNLNAEQPAEQRPADLEPDMPQPQPEDEEPAEPEISEEPATQSETAEEPAPPSPSQPPKKKHKRGNRNAQHIEPQMTSEAPVAPSEALEQPSEPLPLEEVPTDGGAQIRLQIP